MVRVPSRVTRARKKVENSGGRLIPKAKNSCSRSLNMAALGAAPAARCRFMKRARARSSWSSSKWRRRVATSSTADRSSPASRCCTATSISRMEACWRGSSRPVAPKLIKGGEHLLDGPAQLGLEQLADRLRRGRGDMVLEPAQLGHHPGREPVGAGRQHLAELDE